MRSIASTSSGGNSGGVVQVIEPPAEPLLSYQLPAGIIGTKAGCIQVCDMPAGRYTELSRPHNAYGRYIPVWVEDTTGQAWCVMLSRIRRYALEPDAHTARQIARRKADDRHRALKWCERMLDLVDQWPDIIDHLPCDDATAEAIGDLLDLVVAKVKGVPS